MHLIDMLKNNQSHKLAFLLTDLWNESQASNKKKNNKKTSSMFSPERRRKPVTVTDILFPKVLFNVESLIN